MKPGKIVFIVIIVLLIAFLGWFFFLRMNKKKAIDIILKAKAGRTVGQFTEFDTNFLIAWASAIKAKQPTFEDDGKKFETETGKAI